MNRLELPAGERAERPVYPAQAGQGGRSRAGERAAPWSKR